MGEHNQHPNHNQQHSSNPNPGPSQSGGGQPAGQPTNPGPSGPSTSQPGSGQPAGEPKYPHTQSILQVKIQNSNPGYFKCDAEPHQIPGFPHNIAGSSKTIGLTASNLKPIVLGADKKIDPNLIYCSVWIADKRDDTGKGKQGWKVGLLLTAGSGIVHVGPLYSYLIGRGELETMTIDIDTPPLKGNAKVMLSTREPEKYNSISLSADFKGDYSGNSSGLFAINWDQTTK